MKNSKKSSWLVLVIFFVVQIAQGAEPPESTYFQPGISFAQASQFGRWTLNSLSSRVNALSEDQGNALLIGEIEKDLDSKRTKLEEIIQAMKSDFAHVTDFELGYHYFKNKSGTDFAQSGAELRAYVDHLDFEKLKGETLNRTKDGIAKFGSAKNYLADIQKKIKAKPSDCFYMFLFTGGVTAVIATVFVPMYGQFTVAAIVVTSIVLTGFSVATLANLYCVLANINSRGSISACFNSSFSIEKDEYFGF